MNESKLALPILIPDLGKLGHIHLLLLIRMTESRAGRRGLNVRKTAGKLELKRKKVRLKFAGGDILSWAAVTYNNMTSVSTF